MDINITIRIEASGDIYINDKFVNQLCFTTDAVGMTIAEWLKENYEEFFPYENE